MSKDKEQKPKEQEAAELSPREMRRQAHEARMAVEPSIEDSREEFRKYFVELKRKLNLASELENVIWLHLQAVEMNKKNKFDDGVRHFGYKI